MLRFIIRRIAQMMGVMLALSVLLFLWLRSLPGGTVSAMLGERATPESRARLEKALGSSAETWLQMQANHDLAEIRKRAAGIKVPRLEPKVA